MSVTSQPEASRPCSKRVAQARGTETAIAAEVDFAAAAVPEHVRAQSTPELLDIRAEQFRIGYTADVVLAEDG